MTKSMMAVARSAGLVLAVAALAACGGGSKQRTSVPPPAGSLEYSFPYSGQTDVQLATPLVLRFSDPLAASQDPAAVTLKGADGKSVPVTARFSGDRRALVLQPQLPLQPAQTYRVTSTPLQGDSGGLAFPADGLSFRTTTVPTGHGPGEQLDGDFRVASLVPDGERFQVTDMSTLRMTLSQPLDPATAVYGTTIKLLDAAGALVPATLLVRDRGLVIDPDDDLEAGSDYRLQLTNALRSRTGAALPAYERTLAVAMTEPRSVLGTHLRDSEGGQLLSPLSDQIINHIPLLALLLGDDTGTDVTADLAVELGYTVHAPDSVPLRLRRGTVLTGTNAPIVVGGGVPAGFESGEVTIQLLTDATGYMVPNGYSKRSDSPQWVHLLMDVAMSTEHPEVNAGLNQTLLNVELVGTAIREGDRLVIQALSMVTPQVLGLETAAGLLSFSIDANDEQGQTEPQPPSALPSPSLQSWTPGEQLGQVVPGDPMVLVFTNPLAADTVAEGIRVERNGVLDEDASVRVDGASVIIRPGGFGLRHGEHYLVQISDRLTNVMGEPAVPETLDVTLPAYASGDRSPLVLTSYPGFPCPTVPGSMDVAGNLQGTCVTPKDWPAGDQPPLATLPANRPIKVRVSQNLDPASVVLGEACGEGTLRVERIDEQGQCLGVVPGRVQLAARKLEFVPAQPWQDGELYRYTLASAASNAQCGSNAICADFGAPLQTAMLQTNGDLAGGPELAIPFRGGAYSAAVALPLANLPTQDVNSNFRIDGNETKAPQAADGSYPVPPNAVRLEGNGGAGLVSQVNVGCGFSVLGKPESCPQEPFIYLTGALDVDVAGWDEAAQAVRVDIWPTQLLTTSVPVVARAAILNLEIDTEPMVMRIRYAEDANGQRSQPVTAWIKSGADGLPELELELDLLLDAPGLTPPLSLSHDLKSYPLNGLKLRGPVRFLPDGRAQISLVSESELNIHVDMYNGAGSLAKAYLKLPMGGVNLTYINAPLPH
ncbi:Ig-like domain-containing protein [Isoalcanivorax beigongshangi]|uniref:Ig-like domain-containing protein n=1 Tax=Isoalcanivorax beigongshangi TaxID=3238810 RepID=A0ABV4AJG9_9GAMM